MPQISSITLTAVDVGATTETIVFTPVMPQNGSVPAQWLCQSRPVRLMRESLTALYTRSQGNVQADRVKLAIIIPNQIGTDAGGAPILGAPYRADVDLRLPDSGNADKDEKILSVLTKVLQDTLIVDLVTKRVAAY